MIKRLHNKENSVNHQYYNLKHTETFKINKTWRLEQKLEDKYLIFESRKWIYIVLMLTYIGKNKTTHLFNLSYP